MRHRRVWAYSVTTKCQWRSRPTSPLMPTQLVNFTGAHVRNVGSPVRLAMAASRLSSSCSELTARSAVSWSMNTASVATMTSRLDCRSSCSHRRTPGSRSNAGRASMEKSSSPGGRAVWTSTPGVSPRSMSRLKTLASWRTTALIPSQSPSSAARRGSRSGSGTRAAAVAGHEREELGLDGEVAQDQLQRLGRGPPGEEAGAEPVERGVAAPPEGRHRPLEEQRRPHHGHAQRPCHRAEVPAGPALRVAHLQQAAAVVDVQQRVGRHRVPDAGVVAVGGHQTFPSSSSWRA